MKGDKILDRPISKTIRIIDAQHCKYHYAESKFGKDKIKLIDLEARECFGVGTSVGMIKSLARYNHHGGWHAKVNKIEIDDDYPRCINPENYEHILLCHQNEELRVEFLFLLKEKVLKVEGTDEVVHLFWKIG